MFILEKQFADEMVEHAKVESPNEACGLLAGKDGRIVKLYRCQSSEKSPYRYAIDPEEQLRAMREMEERHWDLFGIYHSHTFTPAYPSMTDVQLAFYPDALYFIISLMDPERPTIRAFRIKDGKVTEEELRVEVGDKG